MLTRVLRLSRLQVRELQEALLVLQLKLNAAQAAQAAGQQSCQPPPDEQVSSEVKRHSQQTLLWMRTLFAATAAPVVLLAAVLRHLAVDKTSLILFEDSTWESQSHVGHL